MYITCKYGTVTNNPNLVKCKIEGFKVQNVAQQNWYEAQCVAFYSGYSINVCGFNGCLDLYTDRFLLASAKEVMV